MLLLVGVLQVVVFEIIEGLFEINLEDDPYDGKNLSNKYEAADDIGTDQEGYF